MEIISRICILLTICIIFVLFESYIENRTISKTYYELHSSKIKNDINIIMIADFHNAVFKNENKYLIETIKEEKPDVIIIAGDVLVCQKSEKHPRKSTVAFVNALKDIAPCYYGMGNHEYGAKIKLHDTENLWEEFLEQISSDINIVDNESVKLNINQNDICIKGLTLDKSYFKRFSKKPLEVSHIVDLVGDCDEDYFNILIAHNPDFFESYCETNPDLVLSGHNHGGLVRLWLLGGMVSPRGHIFPKYDSGLYKKDQTNMILTRGLGSHAIRIRFNNKPEVVKIKVTNG